MPLGLFATAEEDLTDIPSPSSAIPSLPFPMAVDDVTDVWSPSTLMPDQPFRAAVDDTILAEPADMPWCELPTATTFATVRLGPPATIPCSKPRTTPFLIVTWS